MEAEKPEECECCQFKTDALKAYSARRNWPKLPEEKKWLCDLCAGTMAGNAYEYPEQYQGRADVLKAICYVGNSIIAAIKPSGDANG